MVFSPVGAATAGSEAMDGNVVRGLNTSGGTHAGAEVVLQPGNVTIFYIDPKPIG